MSEKQRKGLSITVLWLLCALTASGRAAVTSQLSPGVERTPATTASPATTSTSAAAVTSARATENAQGREARALPPEKSQPVVIPKLEQPPVIDGRLEDEAWKSAAIFKNFYQIEPGDNTNASKETEVFIAYDAKFLYVAFRAHDDADKVRATVAKRDDIFNDDYVGIILDTYNDKRKAYQFFFNPLGVQADGIFTEASGEDFSVDVLMESKGALTGNGYVIEVAIPFKSLRYETGEDKVWGIHLQRSIKRFNNELDSWMPISRDASGLLNQAGRIKGFEEVSAGRTLEIIPSLTLSEAGKRVRTLSPSAVAHGLLDPGRFVNEPARIDPGVTVKYGITPTVTLDFAVNPDFAQVEADETVVTVNQRFPIFFEEKRPFFLEGIDIFKTPLQAVHTRAIIDPDYAIKLSGKLGRNTFGLLAASDNAPGNFIGDERLNERNFRFLDKNAYVGILRLKRDIGQESSLGLIATTYNFIERHNHLAGFDGRFRLDPKTIFSFQVLGTTSRRFFSDPDLGRNVYRTGNALAYYWSFDKGGRHLTYNLSGSGRTRDYRADLGFTQRRNTNREDLTVRYTSEPNPKANLVSWRLFFNSGANFDWQGRMQNTNASGQFRVNLQRQTTLNWGYTRSYERLFESEFGSNRSATQEGAFAGESGERSTPRHTVTFYGETTPSKSFSADFNLAYIWNSYDLDFGAGLKFPRVSPAGLLDPDAPLDPGTGREFRANFGLTYQPTDALRTDLTYTKDRLLRDDTRLLAFDDNIFSLRSTYQFTRFTFARLRLDYSTLDANVRGQFLLGWTPNPGTSFYVGYNDDLNYRGFNPFTDQPETGFRRNGRTFFIKMSYLIRRSF
ncbi:MAG: carbohydrate binding family 9 domain-containing protein [Acidobacteria bacterium]|nr:carbohydrate binding family 9 domain-containing protein [Acidobacteriota bacterium]